MYNSPGGKEIGKIKGPTCCIAGCCGSDFDVTSPDDKDLAEIRRGGVGSRGVARYILYCFIWLLFLNNNIIFFLDSLYLDHFFQHQINIQLTLNQTYQMMKN